MSRQIIGHIPFPKEYTTTQVIMESSFKYVGLLCRDGRGMVLAEWWNDQVEYAVKEGDLDPADWSGSAYEQYNTKKLTPVDTPLRTSYWTGGRNGCYVWEKEQTNGA